MRQLQKWWPERCRLSYKIISLQCSWIRRLFGDNFYDWKVIPLFFNF